MSRPIKIGIGYFPLDVDIFQDEKVIPVSSEFGAKGECIIIRVLCAIYRNGYFAECSDAFRFKIAKEANLPESLVSEVIKGLVKWGFFDKSVFDSFGVITSAGIQKRWKEATRKRVSKNELDYWILGVNDKYTEFLPPETTLNKSESTHIKLKEIKEENIINTELKKKLFLSAENPIGETFKAIEDIEQQWLETISMNFKTGGINFTIEKLKKFYDKLENEGVEKISIKEAKRYFSNCLSKGVIK